MDLQKQALFRLAQEKMGYLGQRHKVLSQNVANADTPNYKARDLKPVDFAQELRKTGGAGAVQLAATQPNHLPPVRKAETFKVETSRSAYENKLNKNSVVLEEQMMKVGETQMDYEATSTLYRKYLDMMKIAVGRSQ